MNSHKTKTNISLVYQTAGDERVRVSHKALDGIALPASHPFWKMVYPPNGWGCRCTIRKVLRELWEEGETDATEALQKADLAFNVYNKNGELNQKATQKMQLFRGNVGQTGIIFPLEGTNKHPYANIPTQIKEQINNLAQFTNNNPTEADKRFADAQPTFGNANTIQEAEKEILNQPIEHLYAFRNAIRIDYQKGYKHTVRLSPELNYEGATITHNHPTIIHLPEGIESVGISFSHADIQQAHFRQFAEIRAVSRMTNKVFILKPKSGVFSAIEDEDGNLEFIEVLKQIELLIRTKYDNLNLSREHIEQLRHHDINLEFAKRMGYIYEVKDLE